MYYALRFVFVEHSVCHESIFVLINPFTFLASYLLSTQLALTLTIRKLLHWPSITSVLTQSHYGNKEDRTHFVVSMTSLYIHYNLSFVLVQHCVS